MKKTQILTYKIIIEEDTDKSKKQFIAYAPKLGISDFGSSVEKAQENIREAIICHLEALKKLGEEIPTSDDNPTFISEVTIPASSI